MELLNCSEVCKKYSDKIILNKISLTVNEGEIVGLVGKNGSGKSTLMKSICQLINIDSGSIKVNQKDILTNRVEILSDMSVIIDGPSLYPNLTVKQMIEANGKLRDIDQGRVNEAFNYIDFGSSINKKNSKLSLGMKQEVALAIAFMNKPKLYILDEPINGLDFDNVVKFRNKILSEKKTGCWSIDF